MKKVFKILSIFIILSGARAYAVEPTELLNKAHEAYFKNRISEALENYQALLKDGFENGNIDYNLGNIYFRLGQNGQALRAYEKARRFMPRDKDLIANIQFIRKRISSDADQSLLTYRNLSDKIFFWNDYVTLRGLSFFFCVLWIFFWMSIFARRFRKESWLKTVVIAVFLLDTAIGSSLFVKYENEVLNKWAFVVVPEIEVHPNFLESDKIIFKLREGTKVKILSSQTLPDEGQWLQVEAPTHQIGWVLKEEVGIL